MWIIFCIIDIIRHQHKVKASQVTLNQLSSNCTKLTDDDSVVLSKPIFTSLEASPKPLITPEINLPLSNDSDNDSLDDNNDEQTDPNVNKPLTETSDMFTFPNRYGISNSTDNVFDQTSVVRPSMDATRNISTRRRALDPTGKQSLRTYVRHRTSSIVQHVIGYNYDDNSTVGGLYTRVGIGSELKKEISHCSVFIKIVLVFCFGTVIHAGLSILSNLENYPCVRWTAIIDDFSRLFFSFIQFFFIFKHSNVSNSATIHFYMTNLSLFIF